MNKVQLALSSLLLIWALPNAQAGETMVFNSSSGAPFTTPQQDGVLDLTYQALADRLGIQIQIQLLPAERALLNANAGIDDGDVCRSKNIVSNKYPDLIAVPEVIMPIKLMVFSKSLNFKIKSFKSLRPYRIGILIGRKVLEEKVVGVKALIKFATDKEIIDALENNQIDLGIIEKSQGMFLIQYNPELKALQPALYQGECYLYLNKKHKAWLPVFATELKRMKQDGSIKKIFNVAFKSYLNGEAY